MTHKDLITSALLWCIGGGLLLAAIIGEPFNDALGRLAMVVMGGCIVALADCEEWPVGVDDPRDARWHYDPKRGRIK